MGNERDFLKVASSRFSRSEASSFLDRIKTAGATSGMMAAAKQFVIQNKKPIAAGTAGAALGALTQYMASKPSPTTGLSKEQELSRAAKAAAELAVEKEIAEKGQSSFSKDMSKSYARSSSEFADTLAKHPGRAAALAAPVGAAGGLAVLQAVRKLKRF